MYVAAGKMDTNAWGLLAICLVAVGGLAFWLIMTVGVAPRRPGRGLRYHGKPPAAKQALARHDTPKTPGVCGGSGGGQPPGGGPGVACVTTASHRRPPGPSPASTRQGRRGSRARP